jgi:hypothetical protein
MKTDKMYKLTGFVCLFLLLVKMSVNAQPQQVIWRWAQQLGGHGWNIPNGIICDTKNHVYIGGGFTDTLSCGKKSLVSKGNRDIFLARFTTEGKLEWLWRSGGKTMDKITAMEAAPNDDLYVAGIIEGEMAFGNIEIPENSKKIFVARINKKGKSNWVKTLFFTQPSSGYLLKTGPNGDIYLGGVFSDTLRCDNHELVSHGFSDIFVALFTSSGQLKLLKSFGGKGKDLLTAFTPDNLGNLYLAGNFDQEMNMGAQLIKPVATGANSNVFLACLDTSLEVRKIDAWYSPAYCEITGMVTNRYQNLFITGNFSQQLHLGSLNMNAKGTTDFFVSQLDTTFKAKWIKAYGSKYATYANSLLVNKFNGVMVTGSFSDTLALDSLKITPKSADNNVFSAQFTNEGKITWVENIGGIGSSVVGKGANTDGNGNLYLMGSFSGTIKSPSQELKSVGKDDVFIAKYYNCPAIKNIIKCPHYICNGTEVMLSVPGHFMNVVWNDTLSGVQDILVRHSGTYRVSMVDQNGCVVKDTVKLKEVQEIKFSLGKDTTIATNEVLLLKGPEHVTQYQWQDYSSNKDFLVSNTDGQPGMYKYTLTITDTVGCTWSSEINVGFYKVPAYINLSGGAGIIDLYPNPVKNNLTWMVQTMEEARLAIEVGDLNGKVYLHEEIKRYLPNEKRQLDMASLPSGTYCFSVIGGKDKVTVKIVKE